jgi:hypothetical protein
VDGTGEGKAWSRVELGDCGKAESMDDADRGCSFGCGEPDGRRNGSRLGEEGAAPAECLRAGIRVTGLACHCAVVRSGSTAASGHYGRGVPSESLRYQREAEDYEQER